MVDVSRQQDETVERLIRQSFGAPQHADATPSCLDAETLAAWIDGGLSGLALEAAQSHVADCARCQSLVGAFARIEQAVPTQADTTAVPRAWLRWLVPLTAAAAAVVLWVAVPRDRGAPVPPPQEVSRQAAADAPVQAPAPVREPPPETATAREQDRSATNTAIRPQTPRTPPATSSPQARKDTGRGAADTLREEARTPAESAGAVGGLGNAAPSVPPQSSRAAPATAAAPAASDRVVTVTGEAPLASRFAGASVEIPSPAPLVRWRINGFLVQRSTDGGARWEDQPTGISAVLLAGSAPSVSVCWIVGRAGVVLLSIDGRTWRQLAFPDMTDLSSVRATDARTASVTTTDGRIFTTTDGGATWAR